MIPAGNSNGFRLMGKSVQAEGENTMSSGMSKRASSRYSLFAGSNTRNGICTFRRFPDESASSWFHKLFAIWSMVFVLPAPGTPQTNICFGSIRSGIRTLCPFPSIPRTIPVSFLAMEVSFGSSIFSPSYSTGKRENADASSRVNMIGHSRISFGVLSEQA